MRAGGATLVGGPCHTGGVDVLLTIAIAVLLLTTQAAALVLTLVALRRPATRLPVIAAGLIVVGLVTVSVVPVFIPLAVSVPLAVLGTALAVLGGSPFARWVLAAADGGRTAEGPRGGILVELMAEHAAPREEEILRGGAAIGYLERTSVALGIIAGFPAVIAVVVALKGVGRFSELATPAARERFIVGTLASLLWAGAVSGAVWLAIA